MMIDGSLGDFYGVSETVAKRYPHNVLSGCCAFFHYGSLNIGAEGQFVLGHWPARPLSGTYIDNFVVMLACMGISALLAGGCGSLPVLKARWNERDYYNVNDELCCHTFVAIFRLRFMARSYQLRLSHDASFPKSARLHQFFSTRVHSGIFLPL